MAYRLALQTEAGFSERVLINIKILMGRSVWDKHEDEYSKLKDIAAGVTQGNVLQPVFYVL